MPKKDLSADDLVGNNLREILKEKHMTTTMLEKRTGITKQSLCSYVLGQHLPTLPYALLISWALNTPLNEIFPFKTEEAYQYVVKKRIGDLPQS